MITNKVFKFLPLAIAVSSGASWAAFDPGAGSVPVTITGQGTPAAPGAADVDITCTFAEAQAPVQVDLSFTQNASNNAASVTDTADVDVECDDGDIVAAGNNPVGSYSLSTSAFGVQQSNEGTPQSTGAPTDTYVVYIANAPFQPDSAGPLPLAENPEFNQTTGQAEFEYRIVNQDGPGRGIQPDGLVSVSGVGFGSSITAGATITLTFELEGIDETGAVTPGLAPTKTGDIYSSQIEPPALYLWAFANGSGNEPNLPALP